MKHLSSSLALAPVPGAASDTDAAHERLAQAITSLALRPSARLRVIQLCGRFGVGPTPLREALWRLVGEGFVTSEPQRGFRVAPVAREDLESLAISCLSIEPVVFRRSIQRGGAAWRATIRQNLAAFEAIRSKVGDDRMIDAVWEARHTQFHLSLLSACGWPRIVREIAGWYAQLDRYRRLALPTLGHNASTALDHTRIVELIEAGQEDEAVATLTRHLGDTQQQLFDYFDNIAQED